MRFIRIVEQGAALRDLAGFCGASSGGRHQVEAPRNGIPALRSSLLRVGLSAVETGRAGIFLGCDFSRGGRPGGRGGRAGHRGPRPWSFGAGELIGIFWLSPVTKGASVHLGAPSESGLSHSVARGEDMLHELRCIGPLFMKRGKIPAGEAMLIREERKCLSIVSRAGFGQKTREARSGGVYRRLASIRGGAVRRPGISGLHREWGSSLDNREAISELLRRSIGSSTGTGAGLICSTVGGRAVGKRA